MILRLVEWIAAGLALASVYLTSIDYYPTNIFVGLVGCGTWVFVGYCWRQSSLIVLNVTMAVVYVGGYYWRS